nr:hypothetical protein [Rhodococcus sp. 06-621-2]
MGTVQNEIEDAEEITTVNLDLSAVERARTVIPVLANRRLGFATSVA